MLSATVLPAAKHMTIPLAGEMFNMPYLLMLRKFTFHLVTSVPYLLEFSGSSCMVIYNTDSNHSSATANHHTNWSNLTVLVKPWSAIEGHIFLPINSKRISTV